MIKIPGHEHNKIIYMKRKHWIRLVQSILLVSPVVILPLIVIFLIGFFYSDILGNLAFIVIGINFLVIIFSLPLLLNELTKYYYDLFILYEKELVQVIQQGAFNREIIEIPLASIRDITVDSGGVLSSLLSFGNILIQTKEPLFTDYHIDHIKKPVDVAEKILTQKDLSAGQQPSKAEEEVRKEEVVTEFSTSDSVHPENGQKEGTLYKRKKNGC